MDRYLSELKCRPKIDPISSSPFWAALFAKAFDDCRRLSLFPAEPAVIFADNPNILHVSMSKLIQTFVILIVTLT
jgi:hypothetical protein